MKHSVFKNIGILVSAITILSLCSCQGANSKAPAPMPVPETPMAESPMTPPPPAPEQKTKIDSKTSARGPAAKPSSNLSRRGLKPLPLSGLFLILRDDSPSEFQKYLEQDAEQNNRSIEESWEHANTTMMEANKGLNPLSYALYYGKLKILQHLESDDLITYKALHGVPDVAPDPAGGMQPDIFIPASAFEVAYFITKIVNQKNASTRRQASFDIAQSWIEKYRGEAPLTSLMLHGDRSEIENRLRNEHRHFLDVFGMFAEQDLHTDAVNRITTDRPLFLRMQSNDGTFYYHREVAALTPMAWAAFQGHHHIVRWMIDDLGFDTNGFAPEEEGEEEHEAGPQPVQLTPLFTPAEMILFKGKSMSGMMFYRAETAQGQDRYEVTAQLLKPHISTN